MTLKLRHARRRWVGRLVLGAAGAAALAGVAAIAVADAVTIGEAGAGGDCNIGFDAIQTGSATGAYEVPPGNWLVTGWRTEGGPYDGLFQQMAVWRPTGPDEYTLVGISPHEQIAANVMNSFALPEPFLVRGGDLLGLRIPPDQWNGTVYCFRGGAWDDVAHWAFGPELSPGDTLVISPDAPDFWIERGYDREVLLNVEAVLVPAPAGPEPPVAGTPATRDDCKNGGWMTLVDSVGTPFMNQGDCVSFVATGGKNLARP